MQYDILLILPVGDMSENDRTRLEAAGILAVETKMPSAIRIISPAAERVGADAIAMAALETLAEQYPSMRGFGVRIHKLATKAK